MAKVLELPIAIERKENDAWVTITTTLYKTSSRWNTKGAWTPVAAWAEVVVPTDSILGHPIDPATLTGSGLTHAFFFYFLNSSFDLFLNEGLAQNSEYKRRASLRQTVYRRYSNGEFWALDRLYGRNSYDSSLLIYHEGFSVVDFLIARGGSEWLSEFMRDLVARGNVDESLRLFYGYASLKALQKDWLNYIEGGQDRLTVGAIGGSK